MPETVWSEYGPYAPDWGGYKFPPQVSTTPSAPTVSGNNSDWWAKVTGLGLGTLNTLLGFKLQSNAIKNNQATTGGGFGLTTGGGVGNIGGIWLWLIIIGILVLLFKR